MANTLEVQSRLQGTLNKEIKKLEAQLKKFAQTNKESFAKVKAATAAAFAEQGKYNKAAALMGKQLVTLSDGTKKYETRLQTANRLLKEQVAALNQSSVATAQKTSFVQRMTQSFIQSAVAMGGMILSLHTIIRLARAVGGGIIRAGMDVEQFAVSLQAVAGSAELADIQLKKIRAFAAASPLETRDVTEAFVKLKAVGVPAAFEVSKALGNVGLVFGRSLDDVSTGFISLNRRVLRQFGVIVDRTGKKAVISLAGIRKEVDKNDAAIREGLLAVWKEKYPDALELASNTTSARLAVMRSEFFELGAALSTGVNPKLKIMVDLVTKVTNKLRAAVAPTSMSLEDQIKNVQKRLEDVESRGTLEKIGETYLSTGRKVTKVTKAFAPFIDKLFGVAAKATNADDSVEGLNKQLEALNKQLERSKKLEAEAESEEKRIAILDKVAILRSELNEKDLQGRIRTLREERRELVQHAKEVLSNEKEKIDAMQTIQEAYRDKIKEVQDQIQNEQDKIAKEREKKREEAWNKEKEEIRDRSKYVIKAFKEDQKAILLEISGQDELNKRKMARQQKELERFKDLGIKITESFASITAQNVEIVINQLVIMAEKQGKTVEAVFDRLRAQAAVLESFALDLGTAITVGFGKGAEGLKESVKSILLVLLDFFERKIMLGFVGAGLDAIIFKNPAGLIKMFAVKAAFEAAKAAVNQFQGGTPYAPGGPALVGERGPEMVDLPRGSRVYSNTQTRNMMSVNIAGNTYNITGTPSPDMISQLRRNDAARVAELEELFRKRRVDVTRLTGLKTA